MTNNIDEDIVLKVLALALETETPNQKINYLLQKLYGKDSLSLDYDRKELLLRIKEIAKDLK